jgi:uncharacterized membrane protein YdjX (TVP38/TMEM64 family)
MTTAQQEPGESTCPTPEGVVLGRNWWWLRPAIGAAIIAALAIVYATWLHRYLEWNFVRAHVENWQRQAQENLLLVALIYCGAYVMLTALSMPVAGALSLLAGALFGRWLGIPLASLSATAGGTLGFLASRYLFHDWVRLRFGDKLHIIDEGVRRDGAFYLFSLRLTPVVPFFVINFCMGLTPMRVGTFALTSWLGMLLPGFLWVNAGTELGSIRRPSDVASMDVIGSLMLLGLLPLVLRLLLRSRKG